MFSFYHGNVHTVTHGNLAALPGSILAPHFGEKFPCCFEVATVFHKPKVPLQWERKLEKFFTEVFEISIIV